jgi:hypothetical protein
MSEVHQVLLIPQERYWEWVQAVREYAIHFKVTITPNRQSAGRFYGDDHVVTVIDFPGAWPDDMVPWFQQNFPAVRLDRLQVQSPVELQELLAERITNDSRFGVALDDFRLVWPTNYDLITQPFGANPQIYRRYGLPGHEGVDIRAPTNTPIYACATGRVYLVHDGRGGHAYGKHVRIRHRDGYKTIYAHLSRPLVEEDEEVSAGQLIGLADSTGNSSASHLHLTLKKAGASERGDTNYPSDIIDPTPYLQAMGGRGELADWEHRRCLVGVHGRADGPLEEADYAPLEAARVEAVKLLVNAQPDNVDRCRALLDAPDIFLLARLFADFRGGRVVRAEQFAEWQKHDMERLYAKGLRHFEVHNEPNLNLEGFGACWRNGNEFEDWFLQVVDILRPLFPDTRFGFPGCSPGDRIHGRRQGMWSFLDQCETAIAEANWLGVHCYWTDEEGMRSREDGLGFLEYQRRWPDKLLFITEFSNPSPQVDMQSKGRQYLEYYRLLRQYAGIGAAFSFVLSASADFPHEVWRREDGEMTVIPAIIGSRDF